MILLILKITKMKNSSILLCFTCLIFFTSPIQAQDNTKKHSVGVQLNPYLDSYFFDGTSFRPVFAVRFGFNIKDHLSFGPEVSGYFVRLKSDQMNSSYINLGAFVRYSILPTSRIKPFLEFSPYYTFFQYKINATQTWEEYEYSNTNIGGYLSPGISLCTKNRKFSLDLMYKFSINDYQLIAGKKSVFTYRFNFNF